MKTSLFKLERGVFQLLGAACNSCGYNWFPAIFYGCEKCGAHGQDLAPREFDGVGRLLSWVEVREGEGSFILAMIKLDAGPVVGGIVDDDATPSIGDKVEAYDLEIDAETVIRFRKRHEEND